MPSRSAALRIAASRVSRGKSLRMASSDIAGVVHRQVLGPRQFEGWTPGQIDAIQVQGEGQRA